MSITVLLPGPLRELAGGRAAVEVARKVATVGEAFEALRDELPAVYEGIVTERRELRPHVNVFVGKEDVRWSGGLATPLEEGSQVVVLPSVSGG